MQIFPLGSGPLHQSSPKQAWLAGKWVVPRVPSGILVPSGTATLTAVKIHTPTDGKSALLWFLPDFYLLFHFSTSEPFLLPLYLRSCSHSLSKLMCFWLLLLHWSQCCYSCTQVQFSNRSGTISALLIHSLTGGGPGKANSLTAAWLFLAYLPSKTNHSALIPVPGSSEVPAFPCLLHEECACDSSSSLCLCSHHHHHPALSQLMHCSALPLVCPSDNLQLSCRHPRTQALAFQQDICSPPPG